MSGFFVQNVWMIPCLPLLGALIAALGARWLRSSSHVPVVAGIVLAFLVSCGALFSTNPEATTVAGRWLSISNLEVPIEFRVDGLTTMMLSMVTFVSSLVAIFAVGYMAGDPGYPRFFALIGLFVFSMTGLVLSNNYLLTYVFWEGVGVCSYLLIGYWHTRPAAAAAAMKAFLVNRIGDFGFAIAIFWLWAVVPGHDLSYGNILNESTLAALPEGAKRGHPAALVLGRHGQECADSALCLAARRDGRPDAGLGPDPCRDDGHRGRVPDRPVDAAYRPGTGGPGADRGHRLRHRAAVGLDRPDAERPQAGHGLLDGQPAWLHVHGAWGRA